TTLALPPTAIRVAASKSFAASFRRLNCSSSANVEYINAAATAQLKNAARVSFWLSDPCLSPIMLRNESLRAAHAETPPAYLKHNTRQIQFGTYG
ncbi:MAG: hypothetical protein WA734_10940, partial [Candidatus Acidiferrales bacterium]